MFHWEDSSLTHSLLSAVQDGFHNKSWQAFDAPKICKYFAFTLKQTDKNLPVYWTCAKFFLISKTKYFTAKANILLKICIPKIFCFDRFNHHKEFTQFWKSVSAANVVTYEFYDPITKKKKYLYVVGNTSVQNKTHKSNILHYT